MIKTFEQSRDEISRIVKQFETNKIAYKGSGYKEAHARQELINPFFKALGWDVYNESGAAPDYREVVFEDSVEISGQKKAPDYVFCVGRDKKFFVEAKKPGVNIQTNALPAYQLRRYAWSAKLPLSLLTDFEEFAIYDCRFRPSDKDKASVARINYLLYSEYPDRWNEIYDLFSREAVWSGAYDAFTRDNKKGRGTSEVDAEFLKEIEGWRDSLAKNIAIRNESLSIDQLNETVQKTIDRIIFFRMAEDRKIEQYGTLEHLAEKDNIYASLLNLFAKADARYNSGLFDFSKTGDRVTPTIEVDDKVLRPILSGLYYPQSPYEFSVLPVETLGNIYEQFLGKVIRLTDSHRAKVEEKPEVKKAGGVYYTPSYIVNYIVKNTMGEAIMGKGPKDLKGFRVLDMACGSGSFLLGAYKFLLEHYLGWYVKNNPEKNERVVLRSGGTYRLTTSERKRILIEHIFGVDIDRQAVEVTKLSLLLQVLEGENDQTIEKQIQLFHERVLPSLENNIKCGNSLISPGYFAGKKQIPSNDDFKRINPFDWSTEFPETTKSGMFDCIIGNPPYIRIQTMKEWATLEVEIYKDLYDSAGSGNYDIYVVFVEKALSLLNKRGRMGFILPHKFFNAQYGAPIREVISKGQYLRHIVHFGDAQVFAGATTYTCLLFLDKQKMKACNFIKVMNIDSWADSNIHPLSIKDNNITPSFISGSISADKISNSEWNYSIGEGAGLFDKLSKMPVKLGDIAKRIFQGFKTGADPVYILEKRGNGKLYSKALDSEISIEGKYLRPLYKSGEMKRYILHENSRFIIFPYRNGSLVDWDEIVNKAPKTAEYLKSCKEILAKRESGRWNDSHWYCYSRNQALEIISSAKILTADLNPSANYCFDKSGDACFPGGAAGGYGIVLEPDLYLYIIGLLNSKAVDYYHKQISTNFRGGWYGYDAKIIRNIPIRIIDFSNPAEKEMHDRMSSLVEQILDLHKKKTSAKDQTESERLERLITSVDAEINRIVYTLYGLTDEEVRIVEGK